VSLTAVAALERSYDQLASTVAQLAPPDLACATPCAEFDVRALLSHTCAAAQMFTDVNEGGPPVVEFADVLGEAAPAPLVERTRESNIASWRAAGGLTGERTFAFGTFPAPVALLINLGEIAVHGWDIAVASGQSATIEEEVAVLVLGFYDNAPMDVLRARGAFGPAVAVSADASAPDRLLGLLGRELR
jgi:uncharacterized protein (TIGR03086 family)